MKSTFRFMVLLAFCAILVGCVGVRENSAMGKPRIVCLGDSLTSCGGEGGRYSDILQEIFPGFEVINSGIGGDRLGGGLARLERDLLSYEPSYAVIGLGANDYWSRDRSLNDLQKDYEAIVSQCVAKGIRIVIISCFGKEKVPEGVTLNWDEAGQPLEHYAAGLAQIEASLVKKYRCGYVPDMQVNITPKGRKDLWSDSNHPNAAGNRIVAKTIEPELLKQMFPFN